MLCVQLLSTSGAEGSQESLQAHLPVKGARAPFGLRPACAIAILISVLSTFHISTKRLRFFLHPDPCPTPGVSTVRRVGVLAVSPECLWLSQLSHRVLGSLCAMHACKFRCAGNVWWLSVGVLLVVLLFCVLSVSRCSHGPSAFLTASGPYNENS